MGTLINSMLQTKLKLKKYIGDISQKLSMVAQGDLTARVEIDYIVDFLPIKRSVVKILESLNAVLLGIYNVAKKIADGTHHLSGGAQSLASGTTQQSEAIEILSNSIQNISRQVENTARIAEDTKAKA